MQSQYLADLVLGAFAVALLVLANHQTLSHWRDRRRK
jgi:hypothetical protein